MSPVEIIFVVVGIVILLASCFVGGKERGMESSITIPEEFIEAQKQEILKRADRIFEEKSEEVIIKTDDYLSKISNEKIMAVNDFSTQILEKIDANHKEVVFLYDMLNKKEDEIKQTVQNFNQEKQAMEKSVEDIVKLTEQIQTSLKKPEIPDTTEVEKTKKTDLKMTTEEDTAVEDDMKNHSGGHQDSAEVQQADCQKEEVLKLHKQGKSVLEISKSLGMGQGEVKLIIGLYGA